MLFIVVLIFAFFLVYLYVNDRIIRKREFQHMLESYKIIKENKKINNVPDTSYLVRIIDNSCNSSDKNFKTFYIWKENTNLFLQEISTNLIEKNSNKITLSVDDILFFEISEERLTDDEIIDFIKNSENNIIKRPIARTIHSIIKNKEKEAYISERRKIYVYYLNNNIPTSISLISKNYNTLKNLIPEKELSYLESKSDLTKNKEDILKIIEDMHSLKEKGIITEDEFNKHKQRLLDKI